MKQATTIRAHDMQTWTDAEYALADRIVAALEAKPDQTPSGIARAVNATALTVHGMLDALVEGQYVHASGNGRLRRYFAGRVA